MEKKKTSLLMIGAIAIVFSIAGVTYAFWQLRLAQTNENIITSSCFDVKLEQEGEPITLNKAYPILDGDGEKLEPYTFTISNKCATNAKYQINLESLSQYGSTIIAEGIRLRADYIRAQLNEVNTETEEETEIEKDIVNLTEELQVSPTLNDAQAKSYESYKLATGYLGPNESKSFALRIWLDGKLTMENQDAMNKTFVSKITVTTSYLTEEKIPPVADLELAVCENTVTATGSGEANGDKEITKYEFQLDTEEWADNDGNVTKEFPDLDKGNHTIKFRVTDNKGITSEAVKNIEIKEIETVNIYGKDIPITTCKKNIKMQKHKKWMRNGKKQNIDLQESIM